MINRGIFYAITFSLFFLSCSNGDSPTKDENEKSNEDVPIDSASFFENQIINDAKSTKPYIDRAGWHLRNGRISEGLNDFDMAIDADSTFGPAWSAKADALYLLKEFDSCIEHLDVCLRYSPNHTPCKIRRAEIYIHLKQYEKAFELLNDALKSDDQLHEAYWMKGKIYIENNDIENALSSFQTSVEVNPNFFDGYIKLGITYASIGNPIAKEYYKTAINLRPKSVEARYNLAMYYQENAEYSEALNLYDEILEIDEGNATAAFNSGYIYLEYQQDYKTAEYWFTEAIKRLPYYHQAFMNRGLCRESMDDLDGALSDYNEALRINPTFDNAAIAKGRVLENK